jgi:trimeric autotransporter adhesin
MSVTVLMAVACTLGACADGDPNSTGLVVSPTSVTIAVGRSATVTAMGRDLTTRLVWGSSDASVATVSAGGASATITGVAPGHATIEAQLADLRSSVDVTVVGAAVDRITISAARTVIPLGEMEQLTAQGHKTDNSTEDVTQAVTWASQDPAIASVDGHGLVTVHAQGETAITASRDGARGTLAIVVSTSELKAVAVTPSTHTIAKGLSFPLVANGTFSDGTVVDITAMVTWTTSAATVATVSSAGVVRSVDLGSATITARINGFMASTAIVVGPPVVTSIAITPDPLMLLINTDQQLSVTSTSSDGTTHDVSAMAVWTVTGSAVTISLRGVAHGVQDGNATITAQVDGITDTLLAAVRTPIRLAVDPGIDMPIAVTLAQQQRLQFRALLVFADSSFLDVTATATWSSTAPAIASVVAGRVDAQAQSGAATVTAAAAGFSVPISVQVTTETCHPVINEVLGQGTSPSDEWVELYNPCTQAIDVAGWTLVYHGASSSATDTVLVTLDSSMAPGTFRLYAGVGYTGTGAASPDGVWAGSNGILDPSSFGTGLLKPTSGEPVLVSGVAFGVVVANPFLEGAAAPGLIAGVSGARFPFDGKDTHDGHSDFSTLIPTPKVPNFGSL